MTLADLFSPGSHLSDVPVTYRGMPLSQWLREVKFASVTRQCNESIASGSAARMFAQYVERCVKQNRTPWNEKHIHGPRDNYGIKGV